MLLQACSLRAPRCCMRGPSWRVNGLGSAEARCPPCRACMVSCNTSIAVVQPACCALLAVTRCDWSTFGPTSRGCNSLGLDFSSSTLPSLAKKIALAPRPSRATADQQGKCRVYITLLNHARVSAGHACTGIIRVSNLMLHCNAYTSIKEISCEQMSVRNGRSQQQIRLPNYIHGYNSFCLIS